ncbi:hypothetical protein [Modestobacter sp. Leaf380]|uniref:hypothetical protein n=1 Tax=Modestobacter sp. Leaf380 TaxID=1736356 RepID=UPI0006F9D8DB|nr:hypothetical protein [Modestobacter sp. Leaf380]KQS66669.1 hypothetical protein ASG41_09420 [Modestobacter sp. Leaf380]
MDAPGGPASPSGGREAERDAAKAAVTERVGVQLAVVQVARLLAAPAELAVPLVRRARGQSGVALMPGVAAQGNAVLAGVVMHALRSRGRFPGRGPLVYGGVVACALAPLVALRFPWTVAEQRSALWGVAVQGLMTVPVSLGIAVVVIRTSRAASREHASSTAAAGAVAGTSPDA